MKMIAILAVFGMIAAACGGSASVALASSDLARSTESAPAETVENVAGSLSGFGTDLYQALASGDENLVFSPASIYLALAMTYAGAEGVTADEMARVLHIDLDAETFHRAMNTLDRELESRSFEEGDDRVQLSIANSIWAQQDTTFEQPFLDTLAVYYGAGVRLVDYKTAAEKARRAINAWVADETNDKITELIPEGMLDELTRLVLVNAIYLDATWAQPFDADETYDGSFTLEGGRTVQVPMMHQTGRFAYASGDGWQAVQLPYSGNKLAMLLIVPDDGRFAQVEADLSGTFVADAVAGLGTTDVALTMPKYELRTQAGLNGVLTGLGMATAFDPDRADFSGMTSEERLFISGVVHEAYIAVDEEGTEAAAATGVVMGVTSAPLVEVQLTIDRPFIFALRDTETGAILFFGRVMDPSA